MRHEAEIGHEATRQSGASFLLSLGHARVPLKEIEAIIRDISVVEELEAKLEAEQKESNRILYPPDPLRSRWPWIQKEVQKYGPWHCR